VLPLLLPDVRELLTALGVLAVLLLPLMGSRPRHCGLPLPLLPFLLAGLPAALLLLLALRSLLLPLLAAATALLALLLEGLCGPLPAGLVGAAGALPASALSPHAAVCEARELVGVVLRGGSV
jgi:hypothetical protein